MNPFINLLKKLVGTKIKISTVAGQYQDSYDGKLIFTDSDVFIIKEKNRVYIVQNEHVSDICFDKSLLDKLRDCNSECQHTYCKWLKMLENKDVQINTIVDKEGIIYKGIVLHTEKELCFFRETGEEDLVYAFRIEHIVEILSDETSLSLRSEIEVEEI